MTGASGVGWYGKVAHLGDFVRSGLSGEFVRAWDDWLQRVLVTAERTLQERWHACYMTAPIWRFAMSPGICGPNAAGGVMMPSVDRVGRKFPLCLAMELPARLAVGCGALHVAMQDTFTALESAARLMLRTGATLYDLRWALTVIPDWSSVPTGQKLVEVGSIWGAVVDGCERVLISSRMPSNPGEVKAIFDPNAMYRTEPGLPNAGLS